jgi:hypothetical protein
MFLWDSLGSQYSILYVSLVQFVHVEGLAGFDDIVGLTQPILVDTLIGIAATGGLVPHEL